MDIPPSFSSISRRHRGRICEFIDQQIQRIKGFDWYNYKIKMESKVDLHSESDRCDSGNEVVSHHHRNNGGRRDIADVLLQQRKSIELIDSPLSVPFGLQYSEDDFDTPSAYKVYESNLDLARSSARDVVCKTSSYEDTIAKALHCAIEDSKGAAKVPKEVQNITHYNDLGHKEFDLDRGTMNNNSSGYMEPESHSLFEGEQGSSAQENKICRPSTRANTSPPLQDQKVIEKKYNQHLNHFQPDYYSTSSPQKARGAPENQKYFNDKVFENISHGEEAQCYVEDTQAPFHSNFKPDPKETDVTYKSEDPDKDLHCQVEPNTSYSRRRGLLESEEVSRDKFPSAHGRKQPRLIAHEMKPTSGKEVAQFISSGHQTVEGMESGKLEKINSKSRSEEEVVGLERRRLQHHYPQPGMQQHLPSQQVTNETSVLHKSGPIAIEGQKGTSHKRHRTGDFISKENQEAAVKPEKQRGNQANDIFIPDFQKKDTLSGGKNDEEIETIRFQPQDSIAHPDEKVFCVSERRDRKEHHHQSQLGTQPEQFFYPKGMRETRFSVAGEEQLNYETEDPKYRSTKHVSKETEEPIFDSEKQGVKQTYYRCYPFSQDKHLPGEETVIETEVFQPQGSAPQAKEQVVKQPDKNVRETYYRSYPFSQGKQLSGEETVIETEIFQPQGPASQTKEQVVKEPDNVKGNVHKDQSLPLKETNPIESHFEEGILQKEVNFLKQSNAEHQVLLREKPVTKSEARHRSLSSCEIEMSDIRSKKFPELNASENQEVVVETQIKPEKHTQYRSNYTTDDKKAIKLQMKVENVGQPYHPPKRCHCVKENQVAHSSSSDFLVEGSTLGESIRNTLDKFIKLILQGQNKRTKGASLDDTCSPEEQYLVQQMRRKLGQYKHKLKVGKKILDEQVQRVLSMIHQRNKAPPCGQEEGYYSNRVDQEMFSLQGMVDEMIILAQKYGASETSCLVLEYICCFLKDMAKDETQFRFSPAQSLDVETTEDFLKGLRRVMITEEMTEAELSKHGLLGVFVHRSAETKDQKHEEKSAGTLIIPVPEEKVHSPVVIAPVITTDAEREATPKLFSHLEKMSDPDLSYPAWYMPGVLHSEGRDTGRADPYDESHLESAKDFTSKATQTSASPKDMVSDPDNGMNIFLMAKQSKISLFSFANNKLAEVLNSSAFEVSKTQSQPDLCDTCQSGLLSRGFPKLSTIREVEHVLQDMILFFLLFLTLLFFVVLTVKNYTPCGMIFDRDIIMNLDFRHIGIPTW